MSDIRPFPRYDGANYEVAESVGHQLVSLVQMMRREVELRMTRHDMTDAQWRPLWLLKSGKATTAIELAREACIDAGAVTRMVDRLEDKGLIERVRSENASLKERLDTLTTQKVDAETSFSQLSSDNHRLAQELATIRRTAANAIAIDQQNKDLQERVVNLERELQIVQQENQSLADRSNKDWFLLGAGVLVSGVLVGLILPRLRLQRRSRWGEL